MPIDVEGLARKTIKRAAQYNFHRIHEAQAKKVLRMLEQHGNRADPRNLQLAERYARDVFGAAIYAPWLRVYAAFCGTFKEGWIPDNYYGSVVVPSMKGGYGKLSGLKTVSRLIFDDPAFPDVGYFANGLFFTVDNVPLRAGEVRDVMFRESERIVFKIDDSGQGNGVFIFDRSTFNPDVIRALGNGVMQRFIEQHPVLGAFAPKSVATLRITTVVDDAGRISARACFLRFGRAQDTHVKGESDVCVPVDLVSGRLGRYGYVKSWLQATEHPDSKVQFDGITVPSFAACIQKALDLHRRIPFARCIGWDLTVDRDGNAQVLEWNGEHNDVKFGEVTQGPCFADLQWERLKHAY